MLSRREFLKLCMTTTVGISLAGVLRPPFLEALTIGEITRPPVIWLELGSCTGETISLDNTFDPHIKHFLLEMVELRYHWLFNSAHGHQAAKIIEETIKDDSGEFILVVEGSVVTRQDGMYNFVLDRDGQLIAGIDLLKEIAPHAKHVVAVGGCATFGGPGAAYPNPAQAIGTQDILDRKVINVPGCPAHPDWMIGTLAHLIMYGEPDLNHYNCPTMFFGKTIHDLCHRRTQFENGFFAGYPGEEGCFYSIGCKGPVTYADCPTRQWNNNVNWPVKAGAPCIGCASPHFPDGMMPFFQRLPDINLPGGRARIERVGAALAGASAVGITGHLAASVVAGRIGRHQVKGTKLQEPGPGEKVSSNEIILKTIDEATQETKHEFNQELVINRLDKIINTQQDLQGEIDKLKPKPSVISRAKSWLTKKKR